MLVLPNATTTALVSDSPNGAQEGARIVFTATVTESGSPVTEGMVQFTADGKTQGLPVQVNSNGVAIDTNNTLTPGSHTIQAVYLGTDKFVESSASLTQNIYGLAASIAVNSGNNQSAAVNANYSSPLVAIVKDASGDPVPNVTVTWATNVTVTAPGGTLSAGTSTTDASGLASVNVTANGKAGSFQVTASAVGTPAQFTLTNTAGAPRRLPSTGRFPADYCNQYTVHSTADGFRHRCRQQPCPGCDCLVCGQRYDSQRHPKRAVCCDRQRRTCKRHRYRQRNYRSLYRHSGCRICGSVSFALRNSAAATSTTLVPSAQTGIYGNAIILTAGVNQASATGSVDFFLGTELLGSAVAAGSATLTLNQLPGTGQYLPVGTYGNITATYPGDNNFAGRSSGPVQVTVTKKKRRLGVAPR